MKYAILSLLFSLSFSAAAAPFPQNEDQLFGDSDILESQYGDDKVILCGPGQWRVMSDPNRCGEGLAAGAAFCTEAAPMDFGIMTPVFDTDKIKLTSGRFRVVLEITAGEAQDSYTLSGVAYGLPAEGFVALFNKGEKLSPSVKRLYCD